MDNTSYTDFRANLATYLDATIDSRAPLMITRRDKEDLIVMAASEYSGLVETIHLLSSPTNAAWLMESIAQAKAGQTVEHELVEPSKKITDPVMTVKKREYEFHK